MDTLSWKAAIAEARARHPGADEVMVSVPASSLEHAMVLIGRQELEWAGWVERYRAIARERDGYKERLQKLHETVLRSLDPDFDWSVVDMADL